MRLLASGSDVTDEAGRAAQVRIVVSFIGAFYVYTSIAGLIKFQRSLQGNQDKQSETDLAVAKGVTTFNHYEHKDAAKDFFAEMNEEERLVALKSLGSVLEVYKRKKEQDAGGKDVVAFDTQ